MSLSAVRILNFDDSLLRQKNLLQKYHPVIIDLKAIGPVSRLWSDKENAQKVKDALKAKDRGMVTLLGSGDYHHITSLLIDQYEEPINVIMFDHHPDWDGMPPQLGCGSWVARTAAGAFVKKIILLGISSEDISTVWIQTARLDLLRDNKIEIYPCRHAATKVFRKPVPDNISYRLERKPHLTTIHWQELKKMKLEAFLFPLMERLVTRKVYITIDKDCLTKDYALTNWEEGKFTLDELLLCLKIFKENLDIIGLDIIGEYSQPRAEGLLRKISSAIDHPKDLSARGCSKQKIAAVNEATNLKILELLTDNHA